MCALSATKPLFKQLVTIAPKTGVNEQGEPTFGAPITYLANIQQRPRFVRSLTGETVIATATTAIFEYDIPDYTEGQITFPDGKQAQIMQIIAGPCEAGHIHTSVLT